MMMSKPLALQKVITKNIADKINPLLQLYLWMLVEKRIAVGEAVDYLQIFELSVESKDGQPIQKILHRQEQPEYSCTNYFEGLWEPVTGKIWIIDNEDCSTMLFPEDY